MNILVLRYVESLLMYGTLVQFRNGLYVLF